MNGGAEPPDLGLTPAPPEPPPERDPAWGYSDIALFLGLALPAMLLGAALVAIPLRLLHIQLKVKAVELVAPQFAGYLVLFAALALILRMQYDKPFWRSLGWKSFRLPALWTVVIGMATAYAVAIAGHFMHMPDGKNLVLEAIDSPASFAVMAFFGIALGPLCEELLFRGFLQPVLVRTMGPALGIVAAALPFGLLHYSEYGNSWRHALVVAAAGAAFGWMRHATGSTRAAAFMHAAYNALFFFGVAMEKKYFGH
jgi:uncharacterized protein